MSAAVAPAVVPDIDIDPERYGTLDALEIIATVERLQRRITERFPKSGLRKVCLRLLGIAQRASFRSQRIARPIRWLRALTFSVSAMIVLGLIGTVALLMREAGTPSFWELVQALEAAVNDIVFVVLAVLFLVSIEGRIKRRRALRAIHDLRSLAHIIDMHQLTKDPEYALFRQRRTAASPKHDLSPFELERYLDYCSEMLALIGKIAALYVQHFEDPEAVAAVNDIEDLTSGLARKIWQKIMILHNLCGAELSSEVRAEKPPELVLPGAARAEVLSE